MQAEHAHNMPVFWGHGAADPTVQCVALLLLPLPRPLAPDALPARSYLWAEQSLDHLADMGFRDIEAHTYDGASPESLPPLLVRRALTLSLSVCARRPRAHRQLGRRARCVSLWLLFVCVSRS